MNTAARLAAFLERTGLEEPVAVVPAGLAAIQGAQRQSIPFENLSIPLGEAIACDSNSVFEKLVVQRRGGFCFEHNQLLADMLTAAGFSVRLLLARVLLGGGEAIPPRTHCLVLVRFDGEEWIADAGFGGAYAPPMQLADGAQVTGGDGAHHRLMRIGEEGLAPGAWRLDRMGPRGATDGRTKSDEKWEAQYAFDRAEVAPADMALGCHWAATHPGSRFLQAVIVNRSLHNGFVSLVDRQLSLWRKGQPAEKREIADPAQYAALLADMFGLDIAERDIARLPIWP